MIKRAGKRIKSLIQWTKNVWLETKSWARWVWHYSIPMVLSWPLLSGWVKGAVIILISLSILSLPLQMRIGKVIKDLIAGFWTAKFGQLSWNSFFALVNQLPAIPTLSILVIWGLANVFWAGPGGHFLIASKQLDYMWCEAAVNDWSSWNGCVEEER